MPNMKNAVVLGKGFLRFLYRAKHVCLFNKRNIPKRLSSTLSGQEVVLMAVPLNKKFSPRKLGPLLFRKRKLNHISRGE